MPGPSAQDPPGALTDISRLTTEDLTYQSTDGTHVNAYLARPISGGPYPALIVIHEAGGLGDHIRDVVRRLANLGYVSLGVDLYTREGGPPPTDDLQRLMNRLFSMRDATVIADLESAADLLRSRDDVTGKVGCIGFCMGGRYTLLLACASDRLDAAVDCWGGFIDMATPELHSTPERPVPPLELAGQLHCPLMAAIGAEDHNPSPVVGERLREALAGSPYETTVDVYEGAGHAFFADYRPTYRPEPAAKLWHAAGWFFERHLKNS
jgi:carboxymethylenebutenolidase